MTSVAALLLASALALPGASMVREPPRGPAPMAGVGLEEHLGERIPADLVFTDSAGRPLRLGDALGRGRPVVLTLVYYHCPMLCGLLLGGTTKALRESGLELGRDYDVLTVSIDPSETREQAADKQGRFLQALGRPGAAAHWPFLVGEAGAVDQLARAVGFQYRYDAQRKEFAHTAALVVLTPDGTISRYLYGVEFPPRDLRLALVEAGQGQVGTSFDRFLLTCYRFDPASRRYAFFISGFLRGGGLLVFLALATLLAMLWRRERARGAVA